MNQFPDQPVDTSASDSRRWYAVHEEAGWEPRLAAAEDMAPLLARALARGPYGGPNEVARIVYHLTYGDPPLTGSPPPPPAPGWYP